MRVAFEWAAIAIALFGCGRAEESKEAEQASTQSEQPTEFVVPLKGDDFDRFIETNDHVLVKFYATWCGHCKKMAPDYEAAAAELANANVKLAKVDGSQDQELAEKFEVRGFPTLHFFRRGVPEEYNGGRGKDDIVTWIKSMIGPAVATVDKAEEGKPITKHATHFVGTFKSEDSPGYKAYQNVAEKSRQLGKFFAVIDPEADESLHVERLEEEIHAAPSLTEQDVQKFIDEEHLPLFGPISGDNFRRYFQKDIALAWVVSDNPTFEKIGSAIRKVARNYRTNLGFVHLDVDMYRGHAEHNLNVNEFPALVIHNKAGRYIMRHSTSGSAKLDDELENEESIRKFVEAVHSGEHERDQKSEEPPLENDQPVKVVVGKSFREIVLNGEKDVFLDVYAPFCGHCKKLAPIFDQLGEAFKGDEGITIAKMDGVANESPVAEFAWQAFPSIFYLKKGETVPTKYDGERTVEAFTAFIDAHRTTPKKQSATHEEL